MFLLCPTGPSPPPLQHSQCYHRAIQCLKTCQNITTHSQCHHRGIQFLKMCQNFTAQPVSPQRHIIFEDVPKHNSTANVTTEAYNFWRQSVIFLLKKVNQSIKINQAINQSIYEWLIDWSQASINQRMNEWMIDWLIDWLKSIMIDWLTFYVSK